MRPKKYFLAAMTGFMFLVPNFGAQAHGYQHGDISIGHFWTTPSSGDSISVYGPLFNTGTQEDALISVQSAVAKTAVLETKDEKGGDIIVDSIPLKPGEPVSLAKWDAHIKLDGVEKHFKDGDSFPVTLGFAKAGKITIEIEVEDRTSATHKRPDPAH